MTEQLVIKDLSLTIDDNSILNNINLTLNKKQIIAIVGASGCGKSLLIQAILGLQPNNAICSGELFYQGKKLDEHYLATLRGKKIAYIPQFVSALDPLMKIGKQIQGLSATAKQLPDILNRYQLSHEVSNLYPFQLSGGMARRVLLASALINDVELILADEPTTGLNNALINQMIDHFKQLKDNGKSILVITHDMNVAYQLADKIALFSQGKITKIIDTNKVQQQDFSEIQKSQLTDINSSTAISTLCVEHLAFHYPKMPTIFTDLNLQIAANEIVGIMSPSGSGKSTLAKLMNGYLSPTSGKILLNQKNINQHLYHPIQLIDQHAEFSVNPYWTIKKILLESGQEDRKLWQALGIEDEWLTRKPRQLSGGQLQRVCIARALSYPHTRFLIADEITSQLDHTAQCELWNIIIDITLQKQIGLIIISHNAKLINALCDRVYTDMY